MSNNELQLQRYQIIERIGEGGMADVYLAFDKVLKRECAIKILKADLSENPVALLRFRREAEAASKLHHPNIVTIYDVGETDKRHFIVMEYVKGKTLKSLIQQRGAIDKQEAIFIMEQILEGIVVAHKAGVIHRDIKPQNIMIKSDGTVKITDFGIATTEGAVQLTQHDSVMGSVHYLAPECARGEQATTQSDIYSLGIVFYEMLTGEVPYKGDGAVQVAIKHLKEEIRPIREFNNSIEQSIENIVIKATAKNRQHRYQTAQEMLLDLKSALSPQRKNDKKLVFGSVEDSSTITFDEVDAANLRTTSAKDKTKKRVLWGIIGVSALIIIGVLISFLLSQANKPVYIAVPSVQGYTVDDARSELENLGFEVSSRVTYELTDDIEKDLVIKTTPGEGEQAVAGSMIRLVVSRGTFLAIDDYTGWHESEVRDLFKDTKVTIRVEYSSNSTKAPGVVLKQELLNPGDKVDPAIAYEMKLIVSKPVSFVIPDIIGTNIESAKSIIEAKGGVVTLIPMNSDSLSDEEFLSITFDTVIEVNPTVGTLYSQEEGTSVEIKYWEVSDRVVVNKSQLQAMILIAENVDTTDKTAKSVEQFEIALQNAYGYMADKDVTQAEVDKAQASLSAAIEQLEVDPSASNQGRGN